MSSTFVGYWVLGVFALGYGVAWGAGDLGEKNIRLRTRSPGVYFTLPRSTDSPEQHNFTTTEDPLAGLDPAEIEKLVEEHPEIKDYRLVLIGPAVTGDEAVKYQATTQRALERAGISAEVEIIRHPKTLREKLLNLIPRREDYEPPIKSELKVAAWKILVAESLSFAVLLIPPMIKGSEALSPQIAEIVNQIALPLKVAVPMVVLDIANVIPLVSFRRALSNHNIRLTPLERFGRQFVLGMFFSFNFYVMSQWPAISDFVSNLDGASVAAVTGSAAKMLSIIIPASVFNMLSRTTVGTSLNIWEQGGQDRRFWVAVMEAVTGVLIAPIYILSTMPVLSPVIETPVLNLNLAHLGMLAIGTAGGIAWATLEPTKLKSWLKQKAGSCAAILSSLMGWKNRNPE